MAERPTCADCPLCRLRLEPDAKGWGAYCTGTARDRLIVVQYGTKIAWTKNELIDRLNARSCPGWCPMWQRGE